MSQRDTTVAVVSCGKAKRPYATEAQNLYTGVVFKEQKLLACRFPTWVILSAKYGVLLPTQKVAPYDISLAKMTKRQRTLWQNKTGEQLKQMFPNAKFVCFAPPQYAAALRGMQAWFPAAFDPKDRLGGYRHILKELRKELRNVHRSKTVSV